MKRIFIMLIAAGGAFSAYAQSANSNDVYKLNYQANVLRSSQDSLQYQIDSIHSSVKDIKRKEKAKNWKRDEQLSRWVIDVNALGGILDQGLTKANTNGNYLNGIDLNTGNLKFTNGMSFGGDVQLAYFLGRKAHWGIGTGLVYLYQQGDMTLDNFNVQYQSIDNFGNIFRQWTTADQPVKEKLTITNVNIPLFLKYKNRFTKHSGFTADAGLVYNVKLENAYNTNATFDYQAIYQYANEGGTHTVYDYNTTPSPNDLLVTKAQIAAHSGPASIPSVLNQYRTQDGMNVGVNQPATNHTGSASFTQGTLGFMIRPAYSYYLSDKVAINLGVYYLYQPFANSVKPGYMLTNKIGDYNSVTNSVSNSVDQSYGISLGARFYLGRYHGRPAPAAITDDVNDPTCGSSDGSITIHNLTPFQPVTVNMLLNGTLQPSHTDSVSEFGTVKISGLAAGDYTNIVANVGGVDHNVPPVTLASSPIGYYSESSTNPLSFGACNGTIRLHGLKPGLTVNVKYSLNGTQQPAFSGVIGQDGTVSMTGLCAGNYTNIVVNVLTCTINGNDVTLTNPAPSQPQYYEEEEPNPRKRHNTHQVEERPDVSAPILFDVNKTIIHEESFPTIDEAIYELKEDETATAVIDGYTDNTASEAYNQDLSVRRSESVKYYMEHRGIASDRLTPVGHGLHDPIADNTTEEGRHKNRRVVISIKLKH